MSNRIKQLQQFIEEDPSDPFNYYALGLEFAKAGEHEALDIFVKLIQQHKEYLPTYYQLANLYGRLGQKENAASVYNAGIEIARQQRDVKTLQELMAGLEQINDE